MPRSSLLLVLATVLIAGCGPSGTDSDAENSAGISADGLTESQVEHGIGPIDPFEPEAIDPTLASRGNEVFTTNCSACHKASERYVGPALGDVTNRRSPAYIMNMILNPEEMIDKHPEAKAMFAQFMTPMPNQHLTEVQARAVLEYLRTLAPNE